MTLGASLSSTAALARTKALAFSDGLEKKRVSLNGRWQFRFHQENAGQTNGWCKPSSPTSNDWRSVDVPHTWPIRQDSAEYFGTAWYRRAFEVPKQWSNRIVRIEFEAVFHAASVWLNGNGVGNHLRKGYSAFDFDITRFLHPGNDNVVAVMVNSDFDSHLLPRGHSSDWTHDGGIYRPVRLIMTPRVYIERVDVDAVPAGENGAASLEISVAIRNTTETGFNGELAVQITDENTGLPTLQPGGSARVSMAPSQSINQTLPILKIADPKLGCFDDPNLYDLSVVLNGAETSPEFRTTFGVRRIEVKDGAFWLNGERVRLMGVERMAGSNPNYGMAEPASWIEHHHDALKELELSLRTYI